MIPVLRSLEAVFFFIHPSSLACQALLLSWLRPEVLSPCRVPYTSLSRITKGPSTSYGTPKEVRNTSSPVVKIEPSVSGTPTWAQRSRPTRPTATRFCHSRCKILSAPINEARVFDPIAAVPFSASSSAHDNTKFVSSGGDRSVFLWDVSTGNTIRRISAHLAKINVVEFNNDASVVASGKSPRCPLSMVTPMPTAIA